MLRREPTKVLLTIMQQCGRSDQEKLHGWVYLRRLLRWKHCWPSAHQERDKKKPLPRALDGIDHLVSSPNPHLSWAVLTLAVTASRLWRLPHCMPYYGGRIRRRKVTLTTTRNETGLRFWT